MNLELYRIFYTVATIGNITKASEELCISQPAVSKHLKNMEEILGIPLFVRTKKGVVLTEAGQSIYLKVKQSLTLLEQAECDIEEYNKGVKGTIRIGISTSLMREYLIDYINQYHKIYPNITFTINTNPTERLIEELKNGKIDLIVCKMPQETDLELRYDILGTTDYIFVTSKKYSKLLNRKVQVNELLDYPLLLQENVSNSRLSANNYFQENNINIKPVMNIGSSSLLIDFIKIDFGVGYTTKLYALKNLKNNEIYEVDVYPKPPTIKYGLITLKNNMFSFYIQKFIDMIHKKR